MKANEAPEKIYINDFGSELSYDWHTEHCCENDIEYTRTDAFIEKATTFLCECIEDCMARYMETWSPEMKEKTVDNFKNYMKGEEL